MTTQQQPKRTTITYMTNINYDTLDSIILESYDNKDAPQAWETHLEEYVPNEHEFENAPFENAPTTKEELAKILPSGRYRQQQVVKLLQLIAKYEHVTRNDRYNPIYISTSSKTMLDMYGNKMAISRVIQLATTVSLIQIINSKFRFGVGKNGYGKLYIWNKKVQQMLKEIAKDEGIVIDIKKEDRRNRYTSNTLGNTKTDAVYRIGKQLNIPSQEDDIIHAKLRETYPFLSKYETMANLDNAKLPPCEQVKARPNIKRNKEGTIVKSIGYRMTSGIVSLKEHENENKEYNGVWRKEYLNEVFPNGYAEYDVRSSIYRITYWLNNGIWLDNSIDIYELMYGKRKFNISSEKERTAYKQFCMSLYFDRESQIYAHKRASIIDTTKKYGKQLVKDTIAKAKQQMTDVIGESWGSEIFIYESCIYMNVAHKLREKGIRVVQIYDGFYYDREADMNKLVKECVEELGKDIGIIKKEEVEEVEEVEEEVIDSNTLGNTKDREDREVIRKFNISLTTTIVTTTQSKVNSNKTHEIQTKKVSEVVDEIIKGYRWAV